MLRKTLYRYILLQVLIAAGFYQLYRHSGDSRWFTDNGPVLIGWAVAGALAGLTAGRLVSSGTFQAMYLAVQFRITRQRPAVVYRRFREKKLKGFSRLYLIWASCPKCTGFWLGGALGAGMNAHHLNTLLGFLVFFLYGGLYSGSWAIAYFLTQHPDE